MFCEVFIILANLKSVCRTDISNRAAKIINLLEKTVRYSLKLLTVYCSTLCEDYKGYICLEIFKIPFHLKM